MELVEQVLEEKENTHLSQADKEEIKRKWVSTVKVGNRPELTKLDEETQKNYIRILIEEHLVSKLHSKYCLNYSLKNMKCQGG